MEAADPTPAAGEVLVRVTASGVCASEYHGWSEHSAESEPVRFGHEVVGTVVDLGPDTRDWQIGDTVTGFGGSGFADLVTMRADALLPVPPGIPAEHALGEPLACIAEAFARTPIAPQDSVVVVGTGFMGLGFVQLAKLAGPAELIAVDYQQHLRDVALKIGATAAYHPDELPRDLRASVVVEAAGTAVALTLAGELTAPHGTLCILGYHARGPRELDLNWWYKGISVVHGFTQQRWRHQRAMATGLDLIRTHQFSYAPMITHRFDLSDVDAAFSCFTDRPAGFIKSVIIP
ncbi:MAG TPA: alcohol dehydrogenase catalytic domain-containing protein [Pseudonocardiaceae bacterium]|jgi:threonine dehydrogenase-like Zn-dependent dehydrogenase